MRTILAAATAATSLAITLAGCGQGETAGGSGPSAGSTDQQAPTHRYTTRGRIQMLPSPDRPASSLTILHEPIDNFVNREGEVVGMSSHAMGFPTVADGVDLSPYAVGDAVEFTFEVTWGESATIVVTDVRPMPQGQTLSFERQPEAGKDKTQDKTQDPPDGAPDESPDSTPAAPPTGG